MQLRRACYPDVAVGRARAERLYRNETYAFGIDSHTHFARDVFLQAVGVSEVDPRLFRHLRTDVQAERADILRRQTETQSRFAHPNKATVLALLKSSEGGLKNAAIEERRVSHVARMQT